MCAGENNHAQPGERGTDAAYTWRRAHQTAADHQQQRRRSIMTDRCGRLTTYRPRSTVSNLPNFPRIESKKSMPNYCYPHQATEKPLMGMGFTNRYSAKQKQNSRQTGSSNINICLRRQCTERCQQLIVTPGRLL